MVSGSKGNQFGGLMEIETLNKRLNMIESQYQVRLSTMMSKEGEVVGSFQEEPGHSQKFGRDVLMH